MTGDERRCLLCCVVMGLGLTDLKLELCSGAGDKRSLAEREAFHITKYIIQ